MLFAMNKFKPFNICIDHDCYCGYLKLHHNLLFQLFLLLFPFNMKENMFDNGRITNPNAIVIFSLFF